MRSRICQHSKVYWVGENPRPRSPSGDGGLPPLQRGQLYIVRNKARDKKAMGALKGEKRSSPPFMRTANLIRRSSILSTLINHVFNRIGDFFVRAAWTHTFGWHGANTFDGMFNEGIHALR